MSSTITEENNKFQDNDFFTAFITYFLAYHFEYKTQFSSAKMQHNFFTWISELNERKEDLELRHQRLVSDRNLYKKT